MTCCWCLQPATWFLPKRARPYFESIYAFSRAADDLGDIAHRHLLDVVEHDDLALPLVEHVEHAGQRPTIFAALDAFRGDTPPHDDMTAVAVKIMSRPAVFTTVPSSVITELESNARPARS